MNININDVMTFFFILLCCTCSFLILLLGFVLYILGSERVRQAMLAMSLIKTVVGIVKDVSRSFKEAKNNKKVETNKVTSPSQSIVDAEYREKNK